MSLDADIQATADSGATFQNKLVDTLRGLIGANNDRKAEIDSLRNDHEELKKNHEAFVVSAERENDLRRNEIKSLEERMMKENQVSPSFLGGWQSGRIPIILIASSRSDFEIWFSNKNERGFVVYSIFTKSDSN